MFSFIKEKKIIYNRQKTAKVIRDFDIKTDLVYDESKCELPNGFAKFRIDELLEFNGFTLKLQQSEIRQAMSCGQKIFLSWNLPDYVWQAVLESKKLLNTVTNYLGPNVRLDDLYVKSVRDGLQSVSEGWHDDNVGYRLKVFMVFDVEGIPSNTILMPKNRPNLYHVNVVDELARTRKSLNTDEREETIKVGYEAGDCLVFDTNLPHRGDYASGAGVRHCIIAEFIDRNKADAIVGKAPCGPGQGRRKLQIPNSVRSLVEASKLIDKKLLSVQDDNISYGY